MKPVKEAKKYAKMFIGLVGIETVPQALAELTVISRLMQESREFRGFLAGPVFTAQDREKGIAPIADRLQLSAKTVGFVLYMCETGVIAAIEAVIRHATAIYLEKKKLAKATVMTPVEISGARADRLKASLSKMINRDVDIDYVIDPSLLGGILVKVGSTMYDSSIKGQLRLLKDELIKG